MAGSERTEFRMAIAALLVAGIALVLEIALPGLRATGIAMVLWSILVAACVLHRVRRWFLRGRIQPIQAVRSR